MIALYEATFDRRWLTEAVTLADSMIDLFWDEGAGFFYDTGSDHESLVMRPRDIFDNAQPCGGSVASDVLLRLALITGNQDYSAKAAKPLRALSDVMGQAPAGTGHWLAALDFYVSAPKEIAVVGPRTSPATQQLLDADLHPLPAQQGRCRHCRPTGWRARPSPCCKTGAWSTASPRPTSARTTPVNFP